MNECTVQCTTGRLISTENYSIKNMRFQLFRQTIENQNK